MVTSTRPVKKKDVGGGSKFPGPGGNGSGKSNGGGGERLFPDDSPSRRYRIGMWVGLASIFMMFTSLTSAYIVRAASANDWKPLPMPRILLVSTGIILVSSVVLEFCRRKLKAGQRQTALRLILLTMVLGFGFLFSQFAAWKELVRQGVYVASNPHSSFFYLLTGAHGVHLFGGLLALIYIVFRWPKATANVAANRNVAAVDAFTIYWHFMDGLWLYLFLLLFFWRCQVSTEARVAHFPAADWDGGTLPYRVGHRKLGMWLFIVSDSLTFSALLIGYAYLRASNVWPTPFPFYPSIVFSSVMTLCLLSSSLTMVFGVSASSRGEKEKARKWILATIFFGVAFIVLHAIEWKHLIDEGLSPFSLPEHWVKAFTTTDGVYPSPLFGATFFTITGLHMFHVATGAIYLGVVAARVKKLKHEDVEISGLYWHFVDLVWMFVFPLIYILSVDMGGHLAGH